MSLNSFQDLWIDLEKDPEYLATLERMRFTYRMGEVMEEKGVSRKKLAELLDVSQAYVTQVLRGDSNFTIETMTKFALALNYSIRIEVHPAEGDWQFWSFCDTGIDTTDLVPTSDDEDIGFSNVDHGTMNLGAA